MTARIGLTMGDPAGVGPEICLKALEALRGEEGLELAVVGTASCLEAEADRMGKGIEVVNDGPGVWPRVRVIEAATTGETIRPGELSAEGGRLAYAAIERAVAAALDGTIDAIVTAPINKEAVNAAGYDFAGHTEILAELTGGRGKSCMLLAHDRIKVAHVSTHIALKDVPSRVTPERLDHVITLLEGALRDLGYARPRIGVCALNPHAGENGLFGTEDRDVIRPAVERFRAKGMTIEGPVPGDTVFVKALAGQYDGLVAMYHDQGHIPVKTLGFRMDQEGRMTALSGVNVTLGLPIIRTSVDHGTAFDIAGRGIANPESMLEAIEVGVTMVTSRKNREMRESA